MAPVVLPNEDLAPAVAAFPLALLVVRRRLDDVDGAAVDLVLAQQPVVMLVELLRAEILVGEIRPDEAVGLVGGGNPPALPQRGQVQPLVVFAIGVLDGQQRRAAHVGRRHEADEPLLVALLVILQRPVHAALAVLALAC